MYAAGLASTVVWIHAGEQARHARWLECGTLQRADVFGATGSGSLRTGSCGKRTARALSSSWYCFSDSQPAYLYLSVCTFQRDTCIGVCMLASAAGLVDTRSNVSCRYAPRLRLLSAVMAERSCVDVDVVSDVNECAGAPLGARHAQRRGGRHIIRVSHVAWPIASAHCRSCRQQHHLHVLKSAHT